MILRNFLSLILGFSLLALLGVPSSSPAESFPILSPAAQSLAELIKTRDKLLLTEHFEEALPYSLQTVEEAKKQYGNSHPLTTTSLNILGTNLRRLGQLPHADAIFRENAQIIRRSFGPTSAEFAEVLSLLGANMIDQGELARAKKILLESLSIYQNSSVDEKFSLAQAQLLNNLGVLEKSQNNNYEAEKFFKQSISFIEENPSLPVSIKSNSLNNLGLLYLDSEKLDLAEENLTKAYWLLAGTHGDSHPKVTIIAANLGSLYLKTHTLDKAKEILIKTRDQLIAQDQMTSLTYARTVNNLAMTFFELKDYHSAKPLFREALAYYPRFIKSDIEEFQTTLKLSNACSNLLEKANYQTPNQTILYSIGQFIKHLFNLSINSISPTKQIDGLLALTFFFVGLLAAFRWLCFR